MGGGGAGDQLQGLRAAIEGLDLTVDDDTIVELRQLIDRLEARASTLEAEYSKTGQVEVDGYPNLAAFERSRCAMTVPESHRVARRAKRLAAWPEVGEAWAAGRVTGSQVEPACAKVPERHVARFAETVDQTIEILGPLNTFQTGKVLRYWAEQADLLAEREAVEAGMEPAEVVPDRELSVSRTIDVMVITGEVDADGAAYIDKALAAAGRDDADGETRTPRQRRADALVEICRRYLETLENPDANRRRERLTIVADVLVLYRAWLRASGVRTADDLDIFLTARPGLGELDRGLFREAFDGTAGVATTLDGHPVTDALVAAVASGGTMELLLTSGNRPLSLGRSSRAFSPAQRRAVLVRDGGWGLRCRSRPLRHPPRRPLGGPGGHRHHQRACPVPALPPPAPPAEMGEPDRARRHLRRRGPRGHHSRHPTTPPRRRGSAAPCRNRLRTPTDPPLRP